MRPGVKGFSRTNQGMNVQRERSSGGGFRFVSGVDLVGSGDYLVPVTGICVAWVWGGGASGGQGNSRSGSGAGAAMKTFSVIRDSTLSYSVGTGAAPPSGGDGDGAPGGISTLTYPGIAIVAGGGSPSLGPAAPGGLASGGDYNSAGGAGTGAGGNPGSPGENGAPGGGFTGLGVGGGGAGGFTNLAASGIPSGGAGGAGGTGGVAGGFPGGGGGGGSTSGIPAGAGGAGRVFVQFFEVI